jgi:prepilin-type N-terminal cleavage/methylation domain-containing protein
MRMRSERGITMIEVTIVLTVVAILTAAAAPLTSRTVERGRFTRALSDMQAIRTAFSSFLTDIGSLNGPKINGAAIGTSANEVELLVSDGDIPSDNLGDPNWSSPVDVLGAVVTDFIENHLVQNEPFNNAALVAGPPASGPYSATAWRGAYLNAPLDPDPWGNRYMINTEHLSGTAAERRVDTFVLTAGPDEQIDTQWSMDGAIAGDDDLIVIVRRDAGVTPP